MKILKLLMVQKKLCRRYSACIVTGLGVGDRVGISRGVVPFMFVFSFLLSLPVGGGPGGGMGEKAG